MLLKTPPLPDCHWYASAGLAGPSGSVKARVAVSCWPTIGVVSLISMVPTGASLVVTVETGSVTAENTVSSTPLASL
ncbi:hypothetical protein D3C80_1895810 [compost metagenome]